MKRERAVITKGCVYLYSIEKVSSGKGMYAKSIQTLVNVYVAAKDRNMVGVKMKRLFSTLAGWRGYVKQSTLEVLT
jgi:hypothetical protein